MSRKNKQGCPQLFISRAGLFDILLWGGNACNAGWCHFFVSKNNELFIYMTMYELTNRSAALHRFQLANQKNMVKWSNLLAPCVPSWWKQIHLHVQCLSLVHPIIYFSLHRACKAEKMMKSRDFKLLLKKRLKPRLFLQLKNAKLKRCQSYNLTCFLTNLR